MSDALGGPLHDQQPRFSLLAVYMRVIAMLLLGAGLVRACLILGITLDGQNFSDLAPPWRAGATTLLLLDVFAAVGLWVGAAWGPVMWAVAAVVEVAMYTWFADQFGSYPLRVAIHLLLFAGYLALTLLEWRSELSD